MASYIRNLLLSMWYPYSRIDRSHPEQLRAKGVAYDTVVLGCRIVFGWHQLGRWQTTTTIRRIHSYPSHSGILCHPDSSDLHGGPWISA